MFFRKKQKCSRGSECEKRVKLEANLLRYKLLNKALEEHVKVCEEVLLSQAKYIELLESGGGVRYCGSLKDLIKEKGFTQQSFGEALGVGQEAVANWCNGENGVNFGRLKQMAKLLGVSVGEVVDAMDRKSTEGEN